MRQYAKHYFKKTKIIIQTKSIEHAKYPQHYLIHSWMIFVQVMVGYFGVKSQFATETHNWGHASNLFCKNRLTIKYPSSMLILHWSQHTLTFSCNHPVIFHSKWDIIKLMMWIDKKLLQWLITWAVFSRWIFSVYDSFFPNKKYCIKLFQQLFWKASVRYISVRME